MSGLTIRPARPEELEAVWALVGRAVAHMNAQGNPQWGTDYPTRALYAGDLARGELYAALAGDTLAGVACINTVQSPEYAPLPWTTPDFAVAIHRMAVDPAFQRRGVGRALFAFAHTLAGRLGAGAIRLDTYSLNRPMLALIAGQGFQKVGEIRLHGRPLPYPCFEKAL